MESKDFNLIITKSRKSNLIFDFLLQLIFKLNILRKIEELTLYTIEQQKTINATNKELEALKKQMTAIQAVLEKSK